MVLRTILFYGSITSLNAKPSPSWLLWVLSCTRFAILFSPFSAMISPFLLSPRLSTNSIILIAVVLLLKDVLYLSSFLFCKRLVCCTLFLSLLLDHFRKFFLTILSWTYWLLLFSSVRILCFDVSTSYLTCSMSIVGYSPSR